MNSNDQALLEQMMDEEDGVTNRRSVVDRKYRPVVAASTASVVFLSVDFLKLNLRISIRDTLDV